MPVLAGDIPRVRVRILLAGDVLRVRGPDYGPRRRRMPPAGAGRMLCLGTWVTVLCQDIGDTSMGSGGDTCGLRLSGELR